jgi:hypothetical protein
VEEVMEESVAELFAPVSASVVELVQHQQPDVGIEARRDDAARRRSCS